MNPTGPGGGLRGVTGVASAFDRSSRGGLVRGVQVRVLLRGVIFHVDSKMGARSEKGRRLGRADAGRLERGVHSPPADQAAKAGRVPDRHDGRGEGQEAGHGPPRVHGQQHGHGHLLPGQQHGLRQQGCWDVDEAETLEPGAYEDKYPKSEYFIIDVQSHFTNGAGDRLPQHGIRQEHGLQAQGRRPRPTPSRISSRRCTSTAKRRWS